MLILSVAAGLHIGYYIDSLYLEAAAGAFLSCACRKMGRRSFKKRKVIGVFYPAHTEPGSAYNSGFCRVVGDKAVFGIFHGHPAYRQPGVSWASAPTCSG